jgi:ankyrin repeat protein
VLGICLSSRHYPHIETKGRSVILEDEAGHKEDIEQYIKKKLRLPTSKHAQSLRLDLLQSSRMIFLWVALVIDILNKDYPSKSINQMMRRLREIPEELGDLFEMILQRDGGNPETLELCLKWILFAERPMKVQELYFAVQFGLGEEDCSGAWNQEDLDLDAMKISVKEWSKGLSEIKGKASVVQFIHESVRDFLLGRYKHHWGETSKNIEGRGHEILRDCCMAQVKAAIGQTVHAPSTLVETNNEARFPFLEYSIPNVLHHANSAQRCGLSQKDFLSHFTLDSWKALNNQLEKAKVRRYGEEVDLVYVLAEKNLASLIKLSPLKGSCFDLEAGVRSWPRYGPPLFAALATGSIEAAHVLLEAEIQGKPSESRLRGTLKHCLEETKKLGVFSITFQFSKNRGLLSHLAEAGHPTLIEILLDSAVVDIDVNLPNTSSSRSSLTYAAMQGHPSTVSLLLEKGANVAHRDGHGGTPLLYAAGRGDLGMVTLLLEKGADIAQVDKDGQTVLSYAAKAGNLGVVMVLLEKGAGIVSRGKYGQTPVSYAAEAGHPDVVRVLLKKGADVESKDINGRTLLSWAAKGGHRDVVTLLLENGANITRRDKWGQTPMVYAAQTALLDTVMLSLLERGLPVNLKDGNGRTLLSYAASWGYESVVKTLLQKGAYIEQRDEHGHTPLSSAAIWSRSEATVKLLCDSGAQIDTKDAQGRTPLSRAAAESQSQLVVILCDNGAEIDSKDADGRTPLSWAADSLGYANIPILRNRGAQIDTKDRQGRTPLSWAARSGRLFAAESLLGMGADIRSEDNQGHTPLWYATKNPNTTMAKLFGRRLV